jgi:glycosyltransferase involved in cell wall biosynthesis
MIQGYDFVYYGPEPWAGMWRNRHQLLSRLARANRVVYIEPRPYLRDIVAGWRHGRLPAGILTGGATAVGERLWIYRTPGTAAIGGGPLWRPLAHRLRVAHLRNTLAGLRIGQPIVALSHPGQADARDDLAARLRFYHVVDEYLGYAGVTTDQRSWLAACEDQILAWADLVVAVTPELVAARSRGRARVRLLPNAANVDAYDAAVSKPVDPDLPRPVLGYAGLISARLDLPGLARIAEARPGWSLVLVGDVTAAGCEPELARLRQLPNVHLMGAQPAAAVPALIAGWDVGLIPYRVSDETRHASPLKLYEYLAAGLPVVTADVPAVREFAAHIEIVSESGDWATAAERALAGDSPSARAARRIAVQLHSWDARVETLSEMLTEALGATPVQGEAKA